MSGRAGRDGLQSFSYVLYHGFLITHVEKDTMNFVKTTACRRELLMKEFEHMSLKKPSLFHLGCDNCSLKYECGSSDCGKYASYPKDQLNGVKPSRQGNVQPHQVELLSSDLHVYNKIW